MKQKDLAYLTTTVGEASWVLLELLHRCGIHCFRKDEDGQLYPATEAVDGDLYVPEYQLRQAQRCLEMAGSGDPESEYIEEDIPSKEPETGNGAWRVFLILIMLVLLILVAGLFMRQR